MDDNSLHEKFMRIAIHLSEENVTKGLGGPFGAVVVKDGKIIGESANTVNQTADPTAHAEIAAIRLACKNLNTIELTGAIIYTGPVSLALCVWVQFIGVALAPFITEILKKDAAAIDFDDEFIYQEIEKPLANRKLPIKGLLRNEAQHAFKLWEKSPLKEE